MFGAKLYTVHIDVDNPPPKGMPVFVREGFNFYALIFMAFWAFYHRIWLLAVSLLLVQGFFVWLAEQDMFSPITVNLMYLAVQVTVGFHANDWRRRQLQKKGYVMSDVTMGDSLLRAEQRFFERFLAAH